MKVCCIYVQAYLDNNVNTKEYDGTSSSKIKTSIVPLGISYISSALKAAGHRTYGVLFIQGTSAEQNIARIERDTDVICISLTSEDCWLYIKPLLKNIRNLFEKIKIIAGGTFVTLNYNEVIENKNIDAVCIGEGEIAVTGYVNQYEKNGSFEKTDNLYIKEGKEIIKCDRSLFISDIDALPYPDRHMWDEWTFSKEQHKVLTERGCVYKCIYCANHKLAEACEGKYHRYRKTEDIIREIKNLKKDYRELDSVFIYAENIAANPERFIELCTALKKCNEEIGEKLSFNVFMNVTKNIVKNEKIFAAMKEANIKWVMFGFESASELIRKKLNRPDYSNRDVLKFCKKLKLNRIHSTAYVMFCYPFETPESYRKTLKWLRFYKPDYIGWAWMGALKNTKLYEVLSENNNVKENIFFRIANLWRFVTFKFRVYITYRSFTESVMLAMDQFRTVNKILKPLFVIWKKYNIYKEKKLKFYQQNAKKYFDNMNYKKAAEYLDKIKIMNEPWIYADSAVAYMKITKYNNALKDITEALRYEPENMYYVNLKNEIINKMRRF